MKTLQFLIVILLLPAQAASEDLVENVKGMMLISEQTGSCVTIGRMHSYQKLVKVNGGAAFVNGFTDHEALRLEMTKDEFLDYCKRVAVFHRKYSDAFDKATQK